VSDAFSLQRMAWVSYLTSGGRRRRQWMRLPSLDEDSHRLYLERALDATVLQLWVAPPWLSRVLTQVAPLLSRRWPPEQLAEVLHNLGIMLKSGLPIATALDDLAQDAEHRSMRRFLRTLHRRVSAGSALTDALAGYHHQLPATVRALIAVGEQTGGLDQAMLEGARHVKRVSKIMDDVTKALIYPVFAVLAILAAVIFWMIYVLPEISGMFRQMGVELPWYTQKAMRGIDVLAGLNASHVWFVMAAVVLCTAMLLRRERVRYLVMRVFSHMPISGVILRTSALASITEYLSILLRAGLPLSEALRVLVESINNTYYARRLAAARAGVFRGNSLADEMRRARIFPAMLVRLVSVGEATGTLDQQLALLAEDYRQRLDHVVQSLSELLKPLLIVVAGGLFLVVVVVFLLPVYQLVSEIIA